MTLTSLRLVFAPLIALLLVALPASAQVDVVLHQPPPLYMNVESLWLVDIINRGTAPRAVRLYGFATETRSGRRIADGLSDVYEAPPGFTTINPDDVSPIDYDADEAYKEFVTRTGGMPAGEYTICMYVIDEKTRDTLGRDCINQHVVVRVVPPQLIYPSDNSTVREALPLFTWTPVSPNVPDIDVTYRLQLVEVVGRQSAFDAMESNPSWFEEPDLSITALSYPMSAPPLEPGTTYAWQVIAYASGGDFRDAELARSEVWTFTAASEAEDPVSYDGDDSTASGSAGATETRNSERSTREREDDDDETSKRPSGGTLLQHEVLYSARETEEKNSSSTGTTAPAVNGYAQLHRKLDAGIYAASDSLRFVYDNPYGPIEIECRIYDGASDEVGRQPIRFKVVPGMNYLAIDVARLAPDQDYTLVVVGNDREPMQGRFSVRPRVMK